MGHHERTGTHILITPNGVERGIGLHPLPEDSRWDAEFLRTCKGLPWELKPGRRTTSQPTFGEEEKNARVPIPEGTPPLVSFGASKFYVLNADVERYGATDECPGCTSVAVGGRAEIAHNSKCRERISKCCLEDDDARQQARYRRFMEKNDMLPSVPEEPVGPEPAERVVTDGTPDWHGGL